MQDQGIAIVTELCEANKMKQVSAQIQGVFVVLLHMTEMALYLEYCVSQICGIRPVLGHVEDFSKGIKSLMKGNHHLFPAKCCIAHNLSYLGQFLSALTPFVFPIIFSYGGACVFERIS